ncbi:thiamine pyrophosphokinase [Clostridium sp. DSM 8431]|uniref:thiamine diphosphokinase n=1 Tax=Clostridium sp. DSM 8431 TaxID=1761781 RepID=UPI0008EDBD31|nr:thiamine diphosphokinase [Clostridium sp. DSM 8431]SFU58067.1 thiamine pyrophosphokinase [Clostridium sp. DSM 8431]
MKAVVVTGGTKPSKELLLKTIEKDDYIIGVDSGCNCLYEYNVEPNTILGDFDSVNKKVLKHFREKKIEEVILSVDKDYSDTRFGYEKAKELGFKKIIILGGTGSRMDHTIGNFGLFFDALKCNIELEIVDDHNRIFFINKKTRLKGSFKDTLSFIPMSDEVTNVTIKGAKYLLNNYDMTLLEPRALSNEFLNEDIEISFNKGVMMVIYSKD